MNDMKKANVKNARFDSNWIFMRSCQQQPKKCKSRCSLVDVLQHASKVDNHFLCFFYKHDRNILHHCTHISNFFNHKMFTEEKNTMKNRWLCTSFFGGVLFHFLFFSSLFQVTLSMCKIDEIQDRLKGPGLYAIVINQRGFFYTILFFFFKAFSSVACERPIPAVGNYIRLIDGWLLLLPTTFFIFFLQTLCSMGVDLPMRNSDNYTNRI